MKNKLLLTSALAGSLVFQGLASAQTTISGSLDLAMKNVSSDGTKGVNTSGTYLGRETQINLASKGKLNNGMDYAAGFSFEFDGNEGNAVGPSLQNSFNENVFIDITSGGTTLTLGVDHIQNSDRTLGVLIGNAAKDIAAGIAGSVAPISDTSVGSNPAGTYGVGVVQKLPIGSLSAYYSPKAGGANAGLDTDALAGQLNNDNGKAAYEAGFVGDLGIKGLAIHAFYNDQEKLNNKTQASQATNIGLSYKVDQFTVGVNRKDVDEQTAGTETETTEYGIAYAVTKELSIGAYVSKAEQTLKTADEEVKSIAIGYSLGPVALTAQYAQVDGMAGSSADTNEGDVLYLKLSTKF